MSTQQSHVKSIPDSSPLDAAEQFLQRAPNAPRLVSLRDEFRALASGASGQPKLHVIPDPSLLQNDGQALVFLKALQQHAGTFHAHFTCSIPGVFEEQARLGAAIWRHCSGLSNRVGRNSNVYTLGDAAGVTARALSYVSNGAIETLTCSPTSENGDEFFARGAPPGAYFFLGPYYQVTPTSLRDRGLKTFADGFDVIVEDTTFQMYGPERYEQIALACRNLRDEGIFIMLEKLSNEDHDEYRRREEQKDRQFKSRYFGAAQIQAKRAAILERMELQQVCLHDLTIALKKLFAAAIVTWNSGNFYTVAASNSVTNLIDLVGNMLEPAIPAEFSYEMLPRKLFGVNVNPLSFRQPIVSQD
jgi:hypothetical protein